MSDLALWAFLFLLGVWWWHTVKKQEAEGRKRAKQGGRSRGWWDGYRED